MADDKTPDTAAVDDANDAADFSAGFAGVADTKIPDRSDKADTKPAANGKVEPARDATRADAEPAPEVVQITKKDWEEVRAAAAKTASYDQQLSKAFGTIGNLQKIVNGFQTKESEKPRKVELSPAAFAEMAKDFPELAQQTRAALEAALSGLPVNGNGEADPAKLESMMAQYTAKREIESAGGRLPVMAQKLSALLTSPTSSPTRTILSARWLATKDVAYQTRINGSESAAVIGRAIRLFQRETATAPAKPNGAAPRDTARADRIRAAVQPRGDNAGAPAGRSEDDEFEAGYRSARN